MTWSGSDGEGRVWVKFCQAESSDQVPHLIAFAIQDDAHHLATPQQLLPGKLVDVPGTWNFLGLTKEHGKRELDFTATIGLPSSEAAAMATTASNRLSQQ